MNSNPAQGREQEYNEWYSTRHVADLLALPGVISARRFVLSDAQATHGTHPFKYLAIYEVETDDLQEFIGRLIALSGTEAMRISTALSPINSALFWTELPLG